MDSVIGTSAYTKNHREAFHSTHIRRFQVALNFYGEKGIEDYVKGCSPRLPTTYPASAQWEHNSPSQRRRSEALSPRQSQFAR